MTNDQRTGGNARIGMPAGRLAAMPSVARRRPAALWHALPLAALLGVTACGTSGSRVSDQVRLSGVMLSSGATDAALYAADEAIAKNPRDAAALEARGNALAAMDRVEEAQDAYLRALAISPSAIGPRLALGRLQIRLDPAAAEVTLLEVVKRDPRNVAALSNLGVARDLQNRHAEAQQAYRTALAVEPGNLGTQTNLGLSLVLAGQMAEAITVLRPLAELPNPSEVVIENLAIALAATGDVGEASRQLARIMPQDQVAQAISSYRRVPVAQASSAAPAPPVPAAPAPAAVAAAPPPAAPIPAAPIPAAPAPAPVAVAAPVVPPEAPRVAPEPVAVAAAPAPQPLPQPVVQPTPEPAPRVAASEPPPGPAVPIAAMAPPRPLTRAEASATHAQLAMGATPAEAMETWQALRAKLGERSEPPAEIVSMAYHGKGMFALRTGPFPQQAGAAGFCADVRALGGECWAMTPGTAALPMAAAVPAARTSPMAAATPAPAVPPVPAAPAPQTVAPQAAAPQAVAAAPAADDTPSPAVPVAAAPTAAPAAPAPRAAGGPRVSYAQLAAANSAEGAQGEWLRLRNQFGRLLRDRDTVTQTAEVGGRTVWRLRAGPFQQSGEAEAFCAEVRSAGGKCWAATVTAGG